VKTGSSGDAQLLIRNLLSQAPDNHTKTTTKSEQWKPIKNWPYEVSSLGRVRRIGGGYGSMHHRIIGGTSGGTKRNYPVVSLSCNGKIKWAFRHKLVAEAFIGQCPDGMEVHHKDHNPRNSRADNLEYVTTTQNILHSVADGHRGSNRWNARFTENDIREIRRLRNEGIEIKKIAEYYSVSKGAIQHIVLGHNWRHVQ